MDWNVFVTSWPVAAVLIAGIIGSTVIVAHLRNSADERRRENNRLFEASNKALRLPSAEEEH